MVDINGLILKGETDVEKLEYLKTLVAAAEKFSEFTSKINENAKIRQQNEELLAALKRHEEFMMLANKLIELAKQTKKTPL